MRKDILDVVNKKEALPRRMGLMGIISIVIMFFSFGVVVIGNIYDAYPGTVRGQKEAMNVAKDFTLALSAKEYVEAHSMLSPVTQRLIRTPKALGAGCDGCRPVSGSWKRYDVDDRKVYGTIKFTDDKEMSAEVSLKWYKGEFRITGVDFKDEETKDSRMSFGACCDKYYYFGWVYWLFPALR